MLAHFSRIYRLICDFFTTERRYILGLFIVSRLFFFVSAYILPQFVMKGPFPEQIYDGNGIFDYFIFWDANWYQVIAKQGYSLVIGGQSATAFFPFYPLLTRLASYIFVDYNFSQILVSNVSFLLAMNVLYKLVLDESKNSTTARLSLIFLSFSYGTPWLATGYSESLFLWLTISYFYYAKKDKNILAFIFGFLTGITRGGAIYSLLLIAVMYSKKMFTISTKKFLMVLLVSIAPLIGFVAYLFFLQLAVGDWRVYFQTNQSGWGAVYTFSLEVIKQKIPLIGYQLVTADPHLNFINWSWLGMSFFAGLSIVVLLWKKTALWLPAYILCFIGFFLFTLQREGLMDSMARYSITVFPIYYALGIVSTHSELFKTVLLSLFVMAQSLITIMIFTGYIVN